MTAFTEVAMEASSVNLLMRQLSLFAAENPTFVFDDEPTVKADKPTISGKLIEFRVTITVNGKRQNSAGDTLDEFAIKLVVTFRNELSTSCDLDFELLGGIDKFEFGLENTTTIEFNLDLVYGNKEAGNNFEALEMLLKDYKTTVSENKEPPFDTASKHKDTFEAFTLDHSIALGNTGLFLKFSVTPFMEYEVIGQVDINTSFSVTNSCTVSYVNGNFGVYHNCQTNKTIEVYALAYLHIEVGLDAEVKLYFVGLENKLNATVNLKVGPYIEASGALVYEQVNDNVKVDLAGYVEWGYFYDWDVSINLIFKEFSPDIARVYKSLGSAGSYYLYFEFADDTDEYVIEEYSIDIFETFDHELYVYDLKNFTNDIIVANGDEYRYDIESNPYLYINAFGQLKIKQCPFLPVDVELYIYIGNMAVKTVVITVDVKQYDVSIVEPTIGSLKANKSYAAIGETVSFVYDIDNSEYLKNNEYVVVTGWLVNGEYIESSSNKISFKMQDIGLEVQVVTRRLRNVYEINSIDDLELMRTITDGIFVQTADLDFGGATFEPIGDYDKRFGGSYYGNGYEIKNVRFATTEIIGSDTTYLGSGLFAIADGASFYDIVIRDAYVSFAGTPFINKSDTHIRIGAIAGYSTNCTFVGCSIEDFDVSVSHIAANKGANLCTWIGGICGLSHQNIEIISCSVTGLKIDSYVQTIEGKLYPYGPDRYNKTTGMERNMIGGIIGEAYHNFTIENCYAEGIMNVENAWKGNSMTFQGGIAGLFTGFKGNYTVGVKNCITDFSFSGTRSDKHCISAFVAAFGSNNSDPDKFYKNVESIYYVTDRYTSPDESNSDSVCVGYEEDFIYTVEFIYDGLNFDPMLWEIIDDQIVKVN